MTTRPASDSAAATAAGDGRRFGAPNTTRSAAPTKMPHVTREQQLGYTGAPRDGHHDSEHREPDVGRAPPLSTQPWFAHCRCRGGTGDEGQRGEPRRCDPRAVGDGPRDPTGQVEQCVEQHEQARPARTGERNEHEASPPLLEHQHDHEDSRHENAPDLYERQRQLPHRCGNPRRGAAEVGGRSVGRGRRQRDDHREDSGRETPHAPGARRRRDGGSSARPAAACR